MDRGPRSSGRGCSVKPPRPTLMGPHPDTGSTQIPKSRGLCFLHMSRVLGGVHFPQPKSFRVCQVPAAGGGWSCMKQTDTFAVTPKLSTFHTWEGTRFGENQLNAFSKVSKKVLG